MAPRARACRNLCVNTPANSAGRLDELVGAQGPAKRSKTKSNEASTKASILPKAPTLSLVSFSTKDFFIKFMKVFIEITQP